MAQDKVGNLDWAEKCMMESMQNKSIYKELDFPHKDLTVCYKHLLASYKHLQGRMMASTKYHDQ